MYSSVYNNSSPSNLSIVNGFIGYTWPDVRWASTLMGAVVVMVGEEGVEEVAVVALM